MRNKNIKTLKGFCLRAAPALAAAFIVASALVPANAFSIPVNLMNEIKAQTYAGPVRVSFAPEHSSPAVTDDMCLPLLKSVHLDPNSVTNRNLRPAGTAAARASALSLVFGVRFALGPMEDTATGSRGHRVTAAYQNVLSPGDSHTDDGYALAVTGYRECLKRQALQNIHNNSGSRDISG